MDEARCRPATERWAWTGGRYVMNALLLTVFLVAAAPAEGGMCSVHGNPNTTIIVRCMNAQTSTWFQAIIDRATGTITTTRGRVL